MPNICDNHIKIVGRKRDIEQFKQRYISQTFDDYGEIKHGFSLNSIIPIPTFSDDEASRSIDWANANWGTKWDVMNVSVHFNDLHIHEIQEIEIICSTAWSPPEVAMQSLSSQCPKLYIRVLYEEPGVNMAGLQQFHNGQVEVNEIDDLMTDEYIQEQNELEDADWDVENPYLDDFESDSFIIDALSQLHASKRRRAKRPQQVILFDIKKFQKYNRSALIKYLSNLGKKFNRSIGKQMLIQLIFSIMNERKIKTYPCPVCFTNGVQLKQLGCKHVFCDKCITHWAKDKQTCPLCRVAF